MARVLTWIARSLAIFIILFYFIFSLDVFSEMDVWWRIIIGFLIHNIPVIIMIICLAIAWKNECCGGILYLLLALIATLFFNTWREIIGFLLLSMPLIIIGVLFILNSKIVKS